MLSGGWRGLRLDLDTKRRLEVLAKRARRSKSFLAAEAIAAYVEAESWQLDEIQTAITELDEGRAIPHKEVEKAPGEMPTTTTGKPESKPIVELIPVHPAADAAFKRAAQGLPPAPRSKL